MEKNQNKKKVLFLLTDNQGWWTAERKIEQL